MLCLYSVSASVFPCAGAWLTHYTKVTINIVIRICVEYRVCVLLAKVTRDLLTLKRDLLTHKRDLLTHLTSPSSREGGEKEFYQEQKFLNTTQDKEFFKIK